MAIMNLEAHEINCKVVYYGVGLAGKSTSMKSIHRIIDQTTEGGLLPIVAQTAQTFYFDFLLPDMDQVQGFQIRFHLYTTPGQVIYERSRAAVLNGADGIVFVADSDPSKMRDNVAFLHEIARNLQAQGKNFREFPLVLQYNKRDLPNAVPLETMDYYLNSNLNVPRFEAVATTGEGVFETLRAISQLVISKL